MNKNETSFLKNKAYDLVDSGQLTEAMAYFDQICDVDGNDAEAWLMSGSISGEMGETEQAVVKLHKAIELQPNFVEAYINLGTISRSAGEFQNAIDYFEKAANLDQEYIEGWGNIAALHGLLGNFDEAVRFARKAIECQSEYPLAYANLGSALHALGNVEEAISSFKEAIRQDPHLRDAWYGLARIFLETGQYKESEQACEEALNISPDFSAARFSLAASLKGQGRTEEAIAEYKKLLELSPNNAEAQNQIGILLAEKGDIDEAIDVFQATLAIDPGYAVAANNLGRLFQIYKKDLDAAVKYFQQAINADRSYAEAYQGLGNALYSKGKLEEAVAALKESVDLAPEKPELRNNLAALLRYSGRFEEAFEVFNGVLALDEKNIGAQAGKAEILQRQRKYAPALDIVRELLSRGIRSPNVAIIYANLCRHFDLCDDAINLIRSVLESEEVLADGRKPLHFSLGKLYDARGDYDLAFEQFRLANELELSRYDDANHGAFVDALIETFETGFENLMPTTGSNSKRPIFIVGMPRSGTSLVEQILASHPEVYGAGELDAIGRLAAQTADECGKDLPFPYSMKHLPQGSLEKLAKNYLQQLNQKHDSASRVTDKMPQNFLYLGFISCLFPEAKIIHCVRDPLDTCLSIYFQAFGDLHPYSSRLDDIAKFFGHYNRLMEHWEQVLDQRNILRVDYETLVRNQEDVSREIIDFCGLEWDDNCLAFHNTERVVATASYDQVRQPIYTSSIGRWRNYAGQIEALRSTLGDEGR